MAYRIILDRDACSGFGACVDLDPETFAVGDDGIAVVLVDRTDAEAAVAAARACPMGAIRVMGDDGETVV